MALNNLSNRLGDLGRPEEALAAVEEAVRIRRGLADVRPDAFLPALAMALNNLSNRLGDLGRPEEALAAVEEAVGAVLPVLERAHYFLPDAGLRLAQNYVRRCEDAERQPNGEFLQRLRVVFVAAGLVEGDDTQREPEQSV
jgi:tetratricopeptide (TPR) repeat protein